MTYQELKKFGKEIILICESLNITPIIYGSYAVKHYTNKKIKINDLDFYIPQKTFPKLIKELKKKRIKHEYNKEWQTLIIKKKKQRIEMDSLERWNKHLKKHKKHELFGEKIRIITREGLTKIYDYASKHSDQKRKNKQRLSLLKDTKD